MSTLYDRIISLCKEKGVSGSRVCLDLGLSKSTLSDIKAGRKKGISTDTAAKFAAYFGVSVGYLLGKEEKEKAPTDSGARRISDAELKFALWGDCAEIDDRDLDDVRRYAAFVRERKKDQK